MVRHRVMMQRALILFLTLSSKYIQGQVNNMQGTTMNTKNGREIQAYLGIPYAEPPIGNLRFSNPVEAKSKKGAQQADKYGNKCPQLDGDGKVVGDEDCLFLNVFTPKVDPDKPFPVMVYFHGGNFVRGSAEDAKPDYLLDRDIVLVTVNYRLGALGFMATDDEEALGNFGIKDQVIALKWVRKNISGFGGNSNLVTIFGQDAGGSSVIILAVADGTDGLFHQWISQSGTPISWWSFSDTFHHHYDQWSAKLGKYVNCPTDNTTALVKCLRSRDVSALVDSDEIFSGNNGWLLQTWAPTTEPKNVPGTLITNSPAELSLFKEDWIRDLPAIIGYNADEGLQMTADLTVNETQYKRISNNWDSFLIRLVDSVAGDGHPNQTTKKVKSFYMDGVDMSDKNTFISTATKIITDAGYLFPTGVNIWMMQDLNSPFYMYNFAYRGSYSKSSEATGNNDNLGVDHGDELTYLFPVPNSDVKLSNSDEKMMNLMVDLWTSFAANATPTSQSLYEPHVWKKFIPDEQSLQIGDGSDPIATSLVKPLDDNRFLFWNQLILGELFESLAAGI